MIRRSLSILSLRLSTQIAIFGIGVAVLSVLLAIAVVLRLEQVAAFRMAEATADRMAALSDAAPGLAVPGLWRGDANAPDAPHAGLGPGHHILGSGARRLHVVVRADDAGGRLVVTYPAAPHAANAARAVTVLAAGGAMLCIAVFLGAQWMSSAVLRLSPDVRRRIGRQISTVTRDVLGSADGTRAALADTYTEYVRLLYEPGEREREFVANVGHELRTPITLIRTSCELLVDAPELNPKQRQRVRGMIGAADHMTETVQSFTILARQGDFGPVTPLPLRDLVLELVRINETESLDRHVRIDVDIEDGVSVPANREALSIVLNNLIRNAIRYSRAGSTVWCYHAGNVIGVRDQGDGIPETDLDRIFQPFYRSQRAAEKASFGIGLGLAIVRRICDFYGWRIEVSSRENEGTDFRIVLA